MSFQTGTAPAPSGRGTRTGITGKIVSALSTASDGESVFVPTADYNGDAKSLQSTLYYPTRDAGFRVRVRAAIDPATPLDGKNADADPRKTGVLVWRMAK